MINCPNCRAENPDGGSTCFLCGQRLKSPGLFKRMFGGGGGARRRKEVDLGYDADLSLPETRPVSGPAHTTEDLPGKQPQESSAEEPQTPEDRLAHARSLKDEGRVLLNEGEYRLAIDACSNALELDPAFADAYYNRGLAYLNLGLHERALGDLDQAIRLVPENPDGHLNKGMIYLLMGEPHLAQASYEEALRLAPRSADAYLGRGAAKFDLGRFEGSIADFDYAIHISPNLGFAYNNRGDELHPPGSLG